MALSDHAFLLIPKYPILPINVPALFVIRSLRLESLEGRNACKYSTPKLTTNPAETAMNSAITAFTPTTWTGFNQIVQERKVRVRAAF